MRRRPIVTATRLALALCTVQAFAQPPATLTVSGSTYTLNLPYLEFVSGSTRLAYSARLSTDNIAGLLFNLDPTSIKAQTLLSKPVSPPSLSVESGQVLLTVPRLEFASGTSTTGLAVKFRTSDFSRFTVDASSLASATLVAAPGNVTVSNVNPQTVGSNSFSASGKLAVNWATPAGFTPDHYRISASESLANTQDEFTAVGSATSTTLTGLKAATSYAVSVTACKNTTCSEAGTATTVSGKTDSEVWQLQGSGNSVSSLTKVVSDGNVRIAVMRYGSDAPAAVKNRMQLYYGPSGLGMASGLATALSAAEASTSAVNSYLSFTSAAGSSGLQNPTTAATLIKEVNAGQALPMTSDKGGNVRLYFEANGADGKARIFYIGSQDGYVGKDFNAGTSGVCQTMADYSSGGGCVPVAAIPIESDAGGNSKIVNARQFKIGYPTLTDWRWDEAAGSFMWFTVDAIPGCATDGHNQAYAVWSGSAWAVQYAANGCPKLMQKMQAATPLHTGGSRYKLYYGDKTTTGIITGAKLPFLGQKQVLYGDGASTGNPATLEFEDWESTSASRDVVFLWPNGDKMDSTAEGYIDDFQAVTPTASTEFQVLYIAITNGTIAPFSSAAVLLNP